MPQALSVHLSHQQYASFGFCLLSAERDNGLDMRFLQPGNFGVASEPAPDDLADALCSYSAENAVQVVAIDAPAGWEDPKTRHSGSRICEAELDTPIKVGEPGRVEPPEERPFVEFSIQLFQHIVDDGAVLPELAPFTLPAEGPLALETESTCAWRMLNLEPLPPKEHLKLNDVDQRIRNLQNIMGTHVPGRPTYEQAQALVTGLGALAVACEEPECYKAIGTPLREIDGSLREGYIVCPFSDVETRTNLPRWIYRSGQPVRR